MHRLLGLLVFACVLSLGKDALAQSGSGCVSEYPPNVGSLPSVPGTPNWLVTANAVSINAATGQYTLVPFTATFWRMPACPSQLLMTLNTSGGLTDLGSFSFFQNGQTMGGLALYVDDPSVGDSIPLYGAQGPTSAVHITGIVGFEGAEIDPSEAMTIDYIASDYIRPTPPIIEIQIPAASSSTPPPFAIGNGITGNWFDPNESGHGFGIEVLPGNQMLAEWYVFTPGGGARDWILATGAITGNTAVLTAYQAGGAGGRFPPNFNPAEIENQAWGTITFTFTDCNNGTASWQPTVAGYTAGSIPITRLTMPAGLTCP